MALMSPRFTNNQRLQQAATGRTIRAGSSGRHVHLVQMALIDLGYSMPRSTGGGYSPDGVYGNETVQRIIAFQNANNLSPDGELGRNTLGALDHRFRTFNHRVRLHFRSISLTNVPFQRSLTDAENLYAQYGIKIEFASGMSLGMSEADEQRFNRVDGECNWIMNDGEFNDLHRRGGVVPSTDILVFYVREFSDSIVGCGGHADNRPACTVAADGTRWTTGHEVGHVLLTSTFAPVHSGSQTNLMFSTTSVHGSRLPCLTDAQVNKIRLNPCCQAI